MSIEVSVHPIGSDILLKDVEVAKKNERDRRRKLRLKQVRQQSKDAANRVRQNVKSEKEKKQMAEDKLHDILLKEWQMKKIESLERQYKQCLEEVNEARKRALQEQEMAALMKERKARLDKLAESRGKEAMERIRKERMEQELEKEKAEKVKHFKQTVEDLRSSLISTLPHPKREKQQSPVKKPKNSILNEYSANKENQDFAFSRHPLQDEQNFFNEENVRRERKNERRKPPSPIKKKCIISNGRDLEDLESICSHKTWPPFIPSNLKSSKVQGGKIARRVIHSFNRECLNPGTISALQVAQNKHEQVNEATKQLKKQVKETFPDANISKNFNQLIGDLSCLAQEEKFLRNQLLSQVQENLNSANVLNQNVLGERNETVGNERIPSKINDERSTVDNATIMDEANSKNNGGETSNNRDKTLGGIAQPTLKQTLTPIKETNEEDALCDHCRSYLKHSCVDHSTKQSSVTESISNSSSLTFMSVSKSTVDSCDSSTTTIEGVKVVVRVHTNKNVAKSLKIGKPLHLKKKKKIKKSGTPKVSKPVTPKVSKPSKLDVSPSGSATSYLSPPDRVQTEDNEIIQQLLKKIAQTKKDLESQRHLQMFLSKVTEKDESSSSSEASVATFTNGFQTSQEFLASTEIRNATLTPQYSSEDIEDTNVFQSPKKVDKTVQTTACIDKTVQTSQNNISQSLDQSSIIKSVDSSLACKSGLDDQRLSQSLSDTSKVQETETLINYYCNVADKFTDCINNLIDVLQQSRVQESSEESIATSHLSPPLIFNDSVRLSDSVKRHAALLKHHSTLQSQSRFNSEQLDAQKHEAMICSHNTNPSPDDTFQSSFSGGRLSPITHSVNNSHNSKPSQFDTSTRSSKSSSSKKNRFPDLSVSKTAGPDLKRSKPKNKSLSDDSRKNNHNTSTESELPDIIDELMKRGLISSPFPWIKAMEDPSKKDECLINKKIPNPFESKTDSTKLDKEFENILRSDLSPENLDDILKNLGRSWAVSTWKKIAETSHLNVTPSSSDSSSIPKKTDVDSRSHQKNTSAKHSTPIKSKKRLSMLNSSSSSGKSSNVSPEKIFPQVLSSVDNSFSDKYDLTPPNVALNPPQLFCRKDEFRFFPPK